MKKTIKLIITLLLTSIVYIVVQKAKATSQYLYEKKLKSITTHQSIPPFEFSTIDNTSFSKDDLVKDKNLVIIYFDPDCSLCEKSGKIFQSFKGIHKPSQVIFVSHSSIEKILDFQIKFQLDKISNILFLKCNQGDFQTLFNQSNTPTYLIYNKKQELVKAIIDDVSVKTILRYIKAGQIDI
ncbi:MAG: hypothetical protein OIF50_02315 [Flavobacteriaceae bacterium]|nr:hypothetical protein [Flavobacteriaceae bacterium]